MRKCKKGEFFPRKGFLGRRGKYNNNNNNNNNTQIKYLRTKQPIDFKLPDPHMVSSIYSVTLEVLYYLMETTILFYNVHGL